MPNQKKQHYVPKFYMKEFSDNEGKFSVFNLDGNQLYEAVPYADQCYKNYYYGKDGLWENRLGEMETKWATVFHKLKNEEEVYEEDILLIKQFALYQRQRTLAEGEYGNEERKEILKEIVKTYCVKRGWTFGEACEKVCADLVKREATPIENLEISSRMEEMIDDLAVKVITYETNTQLISSDVPVIAINPFYKYSIGYGCMGLILFFPITVHKLVVIYDRKIYTSNNNEFYNTLSSQEEVKNLNNMQYISAEKILFSRRKQELMEYEEINDNLKDQRVLNRDRGPISTMGPEGHKLIFSYMRQTFYDCDLSFGKLNREANKIPFVCREAAPRKWEKGWEQKLHIKEGIMMTIYHTDVEAVDKTGFTKKELRRGYRKMATFADIYWLH